METRLTKKITKLESKKIKQKEEYTQAMNYL